MKRSLQPLCLAALPVFAPVRQNAIAFHPENKQWPITPAFAHEHLSCRIFNPSLRVADSSRLACPP